MSINTYSLTLDFTYILKACSGEISRSQICVKEFITDHYYYENKIDCIKKTTHTE